MMIIYLYLNHTIACIEMQTKTAGEKLLFAPRIQQHKGI